MLRVKRAMLRLVVDRWCGIPLLCLFALPASQARKHWRSGFALLY